MKILFAMASPEYLRFYDATVQLLAARGHRVALAVNARRDKKPVRLDEMDDGDGRIIAVGLVPERRGVWGSIAYGLRGLMDFSRYLHPRFAAASALRARMKRKVLPPRLSGAGCGPHAGRHGYALPARGAGCARALHSR